MKPHLIVKLRSDHLPSRLEAAPYWRDFVLDKRDAVESFVPQFDRELAGSKLPFWVTREHRPAGAAWDEAEVRAGLDRIFRIVLQRDADLPRELIERIRLIPELEYVRPIEVGRSEMPTHARATSLRSGAFDRSREAILLQQAHLFGRGDPRIRIAVLDTGIDLSHPELKRRIIGGADFVHLEGLDTTEFIGDVMERDDDPSDEVGHGSHVAGIIAAEGINMPVGVAPECSLLAVRTLATMRTPDGVAGAGIVDNINGAIKWAVDHGAHVINASLGIKHTGGGLPHEEVIRYALARGVTVVAASGNDGTAEKYYPGALPGVVAVGATDPEGAVAAFSSYGAPVALVAPGTRVLSCDAHGGYKLASGTSQASPFVAGAAALLRAQALSRQTVIGDDDVKAILRHTCDRQGRADRTPRRGYGQLNLLDACRLLHHTLDEGRLDAA